MDGAPNVRVIHRFPPPTSADTASALLQAIQQDKGTVETDAAAIVTARKTAEESTALLKGLADKSTKVETHIAEYEQQLADLKSQCANQLQTITDLLPGATSGSRIGVVGSTRKP